MTTRRRGRRLIVKAKQTSRRTGAVIAVAVVSASDARHRGFAVVSALLGLLPPPPPSSSSSSPDAAPPNGKKSAARDATKVCDVADYLVVTVAELLGARQSRAGTTALSLGPHPLGLALLRLGKLRGDDDQAQVDHEERTDLARTTRHYCNE